MLRDHTEPGSFSRERREPGDEIRREIIVYFWLTLTRVWLVRITTDIFLTTSSSCLMRGICHDRNRFVLVSGGTPQIIGLAAAVAAVAVVVGAEGGGGGEA